MAWVSSLGGFRFHPFTYNPDHKLANTNNPFVMRVFQKIVFCFALFQIGAHHMFFPMYTHLHC